MVGKYREFGKGLSLDTKYDYWQCYCLAPQDWFNLNKSPLFIICCKEMQMCIMVCHEFRFKFNL